MKADSTLKRGKRLVERYELINALEITDHIEFWEGVDTKSDAKVVVRLYRLEKEAPEAIERFEEQMDEVTHLVHDNIVTVYDYGVPSEREFYVITENVGYRRVVDLFERDSIGADYVVEVFRRIVSGLEAAHKRDIFHGAISPSNILLPEGGAKLDGFGIGRLIRKFWQRSLLDVEFVDKAQLTAYLAPEQPVRRVEPWSDMYSLGLVFYEMLAQTPLVEREHTRDELTPDSKSQNGLSLQELDSLPLDMRPIVERLLNPDPGQRYQKAGQLIYDLNQLEVTEDSAHAKPSIDPDTGMIVSPGHRGAGESNTDSESNEAPKAPRTQTKDLELEWEKREYEKGQRYRQKLEANPSQKRGASSPNRAPETSMTNTLWFRSMVSRIQFTVETAVAFFISAWAFYALGLWTHQFSVDTRIWIGLAPIFVTILTKLWRFFTPTSVLPNLRRALIVFGGVSLLIVHSFGLETLNEQVNEQPLWFMERLQAWPFKHYLKILCMDLINYYKGFLNLVLSVVP